MIKANVKEINMKKRNNLLLIVIVTGIMLLSGCIGDDSPNLNEKSKAVELCKQLCYDALAEDMNLSNGPCLSDDNDKWNVEDWVCDVAHNPRQEIDNLRENQCRDFYEGKAHHFIEVNEKCEVIRVV